MKRWEARFNHASWGLVAVSGVVYGWLKYFAAHPDPDSRLARPWQPVVLAVHILAAPLAVFALGVILRRHALTRLSAGDRDRRRTGLVMTLLAAPVILSGYVAQVLAGDAARRWTGYGHAAIGLIYAVGYALHPLAPRSLPDDASEVPAEPDHDAV
jgi:hypothetical protein